MNPKKIDQRTLPAKVMVFTAHLRDAIMSCVKTHSMIPFGEDVVQTGRRLTLEAYLNDKTDVTAPFAEAVAGDVFLLRIEPKTESIYQLAPGSAGHHWQKLSKRSMDDVARNEGFSHRDNFWQAMHNKVLPKKQTIEVLQVQLTHLVPILRTA